MESNELHLKFKKLTVDSYIDSNRALIAVATTVDGQRYEVTGDRVNQVRYAKWKRVYFATYSEDGVMYKREIWEGEPIIMVVKEGSRLG